MIHKEEFFSEILGVNTYFLIVWPDEFEPPFPGVLLFRSQPEEWLNSQQDHTRKGRNLETIMYDLLAKAYIEPMAFILPRTCNASHTGYISYGKALRPDLLKDNSFIGNGKMDAFLDQELLPRSFASGLIQPDVLATDGFSLGGSASIYHALRRPTYFKSCGSFDGALLKYEFENHDIFPATPSDLSFRDFPYLFGYPPDESYFRRHNPLDYVINHPDYQMPPSMIHLANSDSPQANAWKVYEFLATSKLHNHAKNVFIDHHSDHTWWWVDEHLYRTLPFHSYYLNQA